MNNLDAIQLDLLRSFVVVAGARTFAEAAARRHVSVSAISQQMAALEAQLGLKLFERVGRRARLTDEGRALHAALEPELARIDEAVAALTAAETAPTGRVALGAPRSFAAFWLRPRLAELVVTHPRLRLEVDFAPPADLERRLLDGELDFALLARPATSPSLATRPVYTQTYVAVGAPDLVAPRRRATRDELAAAPWLAFDRDRAMLAAWWRAAFGARAPLPDGVVCQIRSIEELVALAEEGLGLTVVPAYAAAASLAARRLVELPPPHSRRPARDLVHLAWRKRAAEPARLRAVRAALLDDQRAAAATSR